MPRLLLTVPEAAEALAISRSKLYELLASGAVASIRIDGSRRIPLTALEEYVSRLLTERTTALCVTPSPPTNPSVRRSRVRMPPTPRWRQSAGGGLRILSLQHAEPQLPQRYRRDTPLEILETTDIEPCSLKADKDGRICQRPLGDHQRRSPVVSVRVARNSSYRPVVSGPSRTSSRPISDAGSHCRRRESGMIFATGRLSLKTSISSPASTRRKTSAVWLRSSRAGMAVIRQV